VNDDEISDIPEVDGWLQAETRTRGFAMASEPKTCALLRTLAATKPGGALLELGTGTGVGTSWLLSGMDAHARLVSIDNDPGVAEVARRHLSGDPRVTFLVQDAAGWLAAQPDSCFDLVFADAWVGKYSHLDDALRLVKPGGLYVVDDMLPQANWPENHALNVDRLVAELEVRPSFALTKLNWSSGIVIVVRR
jgi:predicted O-methyltransferase YrrM